MFEDKFLQNDLGFGSSAQIDKDKVIVIGHSMGAATVLQVGNNEPRISLVISHDPWYDPI